MTEHWIGIYDASKYANLYAAIEAGEYEQTLVMQERTNCTIEGLSSDIAHYASAYEGPCPKCGHHAMACGVEFDTSGYCKVEFAHTPVIEKTHVPTIEKAINRKDRFDLLDFA